MRKLATIRLVSELLPIDGADSIELAVIDGRQCVVKKGEFSVGHYCIYFEIDSLLPVKEPFLFLGKDNPEKYTKKCMYEGKEYTGFRLRTIKLRGQISQGLALPLSYFSGIRNIKIGQDLSEKLGVVKYEKADATTEEKKAKSIWFRIVVRISKTIGINLVPYFFKKKTSNFPSFIPKTDEERVQNLSDNYLEKFFDGEYYITEKLEGSSMTVYTYKGHFGVCSRNLELSDNGNNMYETAKKLGLKNIVPEGYAFQGEFVGPGVQGNIYNFSEFKYYVYNIYDIEKKEYVGINDIDFGFYSYVPLLSIPKDKYTKKEIIYMADGKSTLFDTDREGIVFRQVGRGKQKHSFKAISNKYLLKEKQ